MLCIRTCLLIGLISLLASNLLAATYHVDGAHGDDGVDGLSPAQAWLTIQHAADAVMPGDTVIVHPGVYFEHVTLNTHGTADQPIVFKADRVQRNRVILTGANPAIRRGQVKWQLMDASLGLYALAYDGPLPSRVLYDQVDLYPYRSLDALKQFLPIPKGIGPQHGYFHDASNRILYVRLHPGGRYGSIDPNKHVMAVGPQTGEQFDGTLITMPQHYNLGVLGKGDAYVTLDGFTFETPGVAGVYVQANHVTVSNSWFLGCHSGVGGNYQEAITTDPAGEDYFSLVYDLSQVDQAASDITIAHCHYTQFPAFDDAVESIELAQQHPEDFIRIVWWSRKASSQGLPTDHLKYEIGIASRIGRNWDIHHNRIDNTFEGLSCHAVSGSVGLQVHDNLFKGICDNAVECEEHARDLHIYRNRIVDTFEAISWQPIKGTPWPGPVYIDGNAIYDTPEYADLWAKAWPGRGVFKIGANRHNWRRNAHMKEVTSDHASIPLPGLLIHNNTIWHPYGRLLTVIGGYAIDLQPVYMFDNMMAVDHWHAMHSTGKTYADGKGPMHFTRNLCAPVHAELPGPGAVVAGQDGKVLENAELLFLNDPASGNLTPMATSPAMGHATLNPSAVRSYSHLGSAALPPVSEAEYGPIITR